MGAYGSPGQTMPPYDKVPARDRHRVSAIYPIDDRRRVADQFSIDFASLGTGVSDFLKLDRLKTFYDLAETQLPRVVTRTQLDDGTIELTDAGQEVATGFVWLVALPHGAFLLVLTVEVACSIDDCIPVLEGLHHRRVRINGKALWEGCVVGFDEDVKQQLTSQALGPDTYQLIFVSADEHRRLQTRLGVDKSLISSLVYRYVGEYDHETVRVAYPRETNRGSGVVATGPYVGVVSGVQGYVENAIFISAMQFIGSYALLREIRIEAFDEMVRLRRLTADDELERRARRALLATMARRLGHLRLELSFGVEAFDRIATLVPSLRIIDFHASLFESADMEQEAKTVANMLERLEQGLRSEIEKLQAEERSSDERRHAMSSVALTLLTLIALPVGVVFGFFGMNASEIHAGASFLSLETYRGLYLFVGGLLVFMAVALVALGTRFFLEDRRERRAEAEILR